MTNKKLPIMPTTSNEISDPILGYCEFRNWTLGEHQDVLFKNSDDKDPATILKSILSKCVTKCKDSSGNEINPLEMPIQLAELTFIKIREISVSDKQDYLVNCKGEDSEGNACENKVRVTSDLSKSAVNVPEHYKPIITVGSFNIKVKLPSLSVLDAQASDLNAQSVDFIANEIEFIAEDEEVWVFSNYTKEERVGFVKSLPPNFIKEFVNNYKVLPRIETPVVGTCEKCNTPYNNVIVGVNELFMG